MLASSLGRGSKAIQAYADKCRPSKEWGAQPIRAVLVRLFQRGKLLAMAAAERDLLAGDKRHKIFAAE